MPLFQSLELSFTLVELLFIFVELLVSVLEFLSSQVELFSSTIDLSFPCFVLAPSFPFISFQFCSFSSLNYISRRTRTLFLIRLYNLYALVFSS